MSLCPSGIVELHRLDLLGAVSALNLIVHVMSDVLFTGLQVETMLLGRDQGLKDFGQSDDQEDWKGDGSRCSLCRGSKAIKQKGNKK